MRGKAAAIRPESAVKADSLLLDAVTADSGSDGGTISDCMPNPREGCSLYWLSFRTDLPQSAGGRGVRRRRPVVSWW